MLANILSYLTILTVTIVLGGVFYLIRSDVKERAKEEKAKEAEDELEEAVKKKHSLSAALAAARRLRGLRK